MRALSCVIALIFVLTGPSRAGSADRDLPGGRNFHLLWLSPIVTPPPDMMAAFSQ